MRALTLAGGTVVLGGAIDGALAWRMLLIAAATLVSEDATYVAAGVLRTRAAVFVGWLAVAAALWTPVLVALARHGGARLDVSTDPASVLALLRPAGPRRAPGLIQLRGPSASIAARISSGVARTR